MNRTKKLPKSTTDKVQAFHNVVRLASLQERFEEKRQAELYKENPINQPFDTNIPISTLFLSPPAKSQNYYPILESLQKAHDYNQFYSPQAPLMTVIPENPQQPLTGYHGLPFGETTYNLRQSTNNYFNMPNNNDLYYQNEQIILDQKLVNKENWDYRELLIAENKKQQILKADFRKNESHLSRPSLPDDPKMKKIGEFEFCKEAQNIIGSGTFSTVYIGNHYLKKSMKVAVKAIDTFKCNKALIDEIYITKSINSPNVVHIYDYYLDQKKGKCYLVLEFCNQGSLESHKARSRYDLTYSSQLKMLYGYFQQILKGLRPLFDLNIIHRDLKLSNILLSDGIVKISDFGFAKHMGNFSELNSVKCGTPSTMAPEIIFQDKTHVNFNKKSDIWSLGVILHELVYGVHPFDLNANDMQKGKRLKLDVTYPLAEDFIDKALKYDLKERMSWDEVFQHPITYINDDAKFLKERNRKDDARGIEKIEKEGKYSRNGGGYIKNSRMRNLKKDQSFKDNIITALLTLLTCLIIYYFYSLAL